MGFSSAALYYLGHKAIDGKGPSEINLPMATHNIKIIKLLRDKTQGNLSQDENFLIDGVIKDLDQRFEKVQ